MKLVVLGNDNSFDELTHGKDNVMWVRVQDFKTFKEHNDADAFFNLNEDSCLLNYSFINGPIFINSVIESVKDDKNVFRINGWNGFLEKDIWEIPGEPDEKAMEVLTFLNKKVIPAPDEPGLISVRIIAMIINEAYFAIAEDVSSEKEIDIAMKLGTNYPFGPFEWGEKIGLKNIYSLLVKLSKENKKYSPAPSLEKLIKL